ncbi:MAG: hypothetical protein CO189_09990 [candidate division Zixibacteria bacterium CG_4_9_14_3_um_filter_46_8]|nr:MAG: hypothetical protein CO189_09990 [candidate division Zixibacteria bacterium CG_4_9_14_3_um_filter_46_8]
MILHLKNSYYKIMVSILAILLALPLLSFAEDNITLRVTGMGVVTADDMGKARDDAINDALRKAVEQAMGTMISAESIVENSMLIEDNIYSKTQGYVKSFSISSEGKSTVMPNVYEVTIDATVSAADIKNDLVALGILMQRKGLPKIMVMIEEQNLSDQDYYREGYDLNTAEEALQEIFRAKGFRFVDQKTAFRNIQKSAEMAAFSGDTRAAAVIGNQSGAEVIITGKAISQKANVSAPMGGMISVQANVNLRAIRTDNADVLGTAAEHAPQVHIDEITGGVLAIQKATKKASETLASRIIETWSADLASGMRVAITFHNVQSFEDLNQLKFVIQDYVRGVKSINQRSFGGGVAILDVETTSTANDIAAELTGKSNPNYLFEVITVSANNLELKIKKK